MLLGILLASGLMLSGGEVREAPRELKLRLVEVINADRKAAGLDPVEYSDELSKAADAHCREMLQEDYVSHWNRDGWKPYLRYASAGIGDATSENIHSTWSTHFDPAQVWSYLMDGHAAFMVEKPPYDGHRRSILNGQHTHVGIGVAFNSQGMRLIELFGGRYAELEPLPVRARLKDSLMLRGRLLRPGDKVYGIEVYYEPLPQPMGRKQLQATLSYSLPAEKKLEGRRLTGALYSDGTAGTVTNEGSRFSLSVSFWKRQPGVYTLAVWIDPGGKRAFLGATTSVIVEE